MPDAASALGVFLVGVAAAVVGAMVGGGSLLTLSSFALFAASGIVDYGMGLVLMAGTAVGGYLGAHIAIQRGDRWVRRVFAVVVLASAARLLLGGPTG